jgi:hypothetical protein
MGHWSLGSEPRPYAGPREEGPVRCKAPGLCVEAGLMGGLPSGFHLNNQLTQALTSRYRDSRLRVDFERFVSCVAQLTCIFRKCHPSS